MHFDVSIEDIRAAASRLAGRTRLTPSYASAALGALTGRETRIKLDCLQLAGSFKVRGAFNKLLSLGEAELAAGVVAVSAGNHAIAVAVAARALGTAARVYMPDNTLQLNIDVARGHGAEVVLVPDLAAGFTRAEEDARAGKTFVHPYDDPLVIAGQGTLGLEFLADAPDLTHLYVSIGGGGLIAGVAAAVKALRPDLTIIGVETELAATMWEALAADRPVTIAPSSIARTLNSPFVTERTLAAARAFVSEVVLVPDGDVVRDLLLILDREKLLVEPAAACVLTAARRHAPGLPRDAVIGLVLCGSNLDRRMLPQWQREFGLADAALH